ncbi:hypothetical protein SANTM175S_08813 [Streptomyces antimycoticus]
MAGQIVVAGIVVQFAQYAFAQRGGVPGVLVPHPQIDPGRVRAVDDVHDPDLALVVEGEVGGGGELVAQRGQGGPDPGEQRLLPASGLEGVQLVADHETAVVQPTQIAVVDQRPQQVVGGRERQPRLPCEPLGRHTALMRAHRLHQPQGPLYGCDQRRRRVNTHTSSLLPL